MLTTSVGLNIGIVVGALILVTGLICAGWAVVEHLRTLAARRRRAAARTERQAARAAVAPRPVLTDEEHALFWEFVDENPALSSRLAQLWAGIEPDKEQAS